MGKLEQPGQLQIVEMLITDLLLAFKNDQEIKKQKSLHVYFKAGQKLLSK